MFCHLRAVPLGHVADYAVYTESKEKSSILLTCQLYLSNSSLSLSTKKLNAIDQIMNI